MLGFLKDLFSNHWLWCPVVAWCIAQSLKVLISSAIEKKFCYKKFFSDGGMPSGHSATVISLAVLIAWTYGVGSVYFAVATLFAVIVMKDAVGVRRETGKQTQVIKQLVEETVEKRDAKQWTIVDKLKDFVGHTKLQVLCGALVGAVVAVFAILILRLNPMFLKGQA